MSHPLSFELQQKPGQNIKQLQRLIMSRQMQQAIHVLQMPIMELTPLIDKELEQNPVLEYSKEGEQDINDEELTQLESEIKEDSLDMDSNPEKELSFDDKDFEILRRLDEDFRDHFHEDSGNSMKRTSEQEKLQTFLESSIIEEKGLFEYLMQQAREVFDGKQLAIAEILIGNFDENGFISASLQELSVLAGFGIEEMEAVLKIIQTFEPIGIGAKNLKESLLIQLNSQEKANTLAYLIIDKHFEDLLQNHIPTIKKELNCTAEQIAQAVDEDIASLDLHPGTRLSRHVVSFITPDLSLRQEGEKLITSINDDAMPRLRLNSRYLRMLNDENLSKETKDFIKKKIISAKWLLRNILQRNDTLEKIAQSLIKWQSEFFLNPNGKLVPLTMKVMADELGVHESTIARAVSEKYIDTPRGVLPLRSFFTNKLSTKAGIDVSSKTAMELLQEIIKGEDKKNPYSDEAISALIKAKGIQCARRTVAKYRVALKIGTAQQRKKF